MTFSPYRKKVFEEAQWMQVNGRPDGKKCCSAKREITKSIWALTSIMECSTYTANIIYLFYHFFAKSLSFVEIVGVLFTRTNFSTCYLPNSRFSTIQQIHKLLLLNNYLWFTDEMLSLRNSDSYGVDFKQRANRRYLSITNCRYTQNWWHCGSFQGIRCQWHCWIPWQYTADWVGFRNRPFMCYWCWTLWLTAVRVPLMNE